MCSLQERCHNHRLTEALYIALKRSKDLIDDSILEKLDAFVETNTSTKQITDYVATRLGMYTLATPCLCFYSFDVHVVLAN